MKKKIVICLLCGLMVSSFTACGNTKNDSTEAIEQGVGEQGQIQEKFAKGKRSGQYKIDVDKQVTELSEYNGIELKISKNYEVTEDAMNEYLKTLFAGYGADAFEEVKDHDVVEAGDIVKVDYTGYKDDEKFDGGEAKDQYLDVSGNCDATRGSGYIDGFTDGLLGAKVGETISQPCTFPENYGSEELAGKDVVFKFKVKAICKPLTLDTITDEKVAEIFQSDVVNTVATLKEAINAQLEQNLYVQKVNAAKEYVVENSKVDVPEDYLTARVNEYADSFVKDNCSGTETLETFLANNGATKDDAWKNWTTSLEDQIKSEFVFGVVANKEKIEVDEKAFNSYMEYLVSNSNGAFADAEAVYKYYGADNVKEGETYLKEQYRVNKAIDFIVNNAKVTFTE